MNARTRRPPVGHIVLTTRRAFHLMALRVTRAHRELLSKDDARAVADAAAVEAAKSWDATRGIPFGVYARHWVCGALLRALQRERAQRRVCKAAARELVAEPESSVEDRVAARHLLSTLRAYDRRFLIAHHFDEVPLNKLASRSNHHPSWACRRHARLRTALATGTPVAVKQKRTTTPARASRAE